MNPPQLTPARAIGMKRESVHKQYIFERGRWWDHVVWAKMRKKHYPWLK